MESRFGSESNRPRPRLCILMKLTRILFHIEGGRQFNTCNASTVLNCTLRILKAKIFRPSWQSIFLPHVAVDAGAVQHIHNDAAIKILP